jgi:hypothetical protein
LHDTEGEGAPLQAFDGGNGIGAGTRQGQGSARFGEQGVTGRGEGDPPGAAHEQRGAQLLFEGADRGRESGLGDVEACRGAGEVALLGHRHERLELAELHLATLLLSEIRYCCWISG